MILSILSIVATGFIAILGLTKIGNKKSIKIIFSISIIITTIITLTDLISNNRQISYLQKSSAQKDENINNIKEYFYISKLGFNGFTQNFNNTGMTTDDPLYKLLEDTYFKENELIKYKCSKEATDKYKIGIIDYPKFPFTWYALGECKYLNGEDDWETYSKRAKEILEITITIGGHRKEHDEALKIINGYLK